MLHRRGRGQRPQRIGYVIVIVLRAGNRVELQGASQASQVIVIDRMTEMALLGPAPGPKEPPQQGITALAGGHRAGVGTICVTLIRAAPRDVVISLRSTS